jgi:hypothetical protein
MDLLPPSDHAGGPRRRAADLDEGLAQEASRRLHAIGRTRTLIGDRREVAAEHFAGCIRGGAIGEIHPDQRIFGLPRALRGCRHAAEGNARSGDAGAVEPQLECPHHRRDVLIEALGNLECGNAAGRELGHADSAHESLASLLAAMSDEEVFQASSRSNIAALDTSVTPGRDQRGASPIGEPLAMLRRACRHCGPVAGETA